MQAGIEGRVVNTNYALLTLIGSYLCLASAERPFQNSWSASAQRRHNVLLLIYFGVLIVSLMFSVRGRHCDS